MKVEENNMTNPQTQPLVDAVGTVTTEEETLTYLGFTEDEITSLLWLRQWYQYGGSDRIEIVRRLEFVQQLLLHGQIER